MWYHYIQLDFPAAYSSANDAVALFGLSKQMIFMDPDLYLRCVYYVVMLAYLNKDKKEVLRHFNKIKHFLSDERIQLNENSKMIGAVYLNLSKFHLYFLKGDRLSASNLGKELLASFANESFRPNEHRWGLFLYKYAASLFLNKEYSTALDHLNIIINMRSNIFREDLLISTRLLHAICNFELGNYILLEYQLTGLSRLLRRSREAAECHRQAVNALSRLRKLPASEHQLVYETLDASLNKLKHSVFEQKALNYLDLRLWLEDKI